MASRLPESPAFLAAIAANPDDDLPRLVYADWLDENGDPDRAEFIRIQIELAKLPGHDFRRVDLLERERELLVTHRSEWRLPEFPDRVQVFHRGFVDRVEAPAEWLLDHPGSLPTSPMVRELKVVNIARVGMRLTELPGLDRIEHLDLTNNFTGPTFNFAAFLTDAKLDRLKALSLGNCRLWPWDIEQLVEVPVCRQLVSLAVWGNPLSDTGTRYLADSSNFPNLEALDLSAHEQPFTECIHADGAMALADSVHLTRLRVLNIGEHHIGDAGLIRLVQSRNARTLERLVVSYNEIGLLGDSGIEAVVETPHLENLREFVFVGNQFSVLGAEALAGWRHLEQMRFVDLRECEFNDISRQQLLTSRWADKFIL